MGALLVPIVVGTAAALLIGGGSYALWGNAASFRGGVVTAGDLSMATGTTAWRQVTAGPVTGASGDLTQSPVDFRSMPGDVVQFRVPVTTTLRGDNLSGALSVDFQDPAAARQAVADGLIAVGFHVEDAAGVQVAPAVGEEEPGAALSVPGLVGDDAGVTADWTVVVTVEVLGDYRWVGSAADADPLAWAAGNLTVRLTQVREGAGFTAGGAP